MDPAIRVGQLVKAAAETPGTVVGHRGWVIQIRNGHLAPYAEWPEAESSTPSQRTFLTSGAGTIYPPGLLPTDILCDYELAAKLAPNADDIWFWAVTRHAGASLRCLGINEVDPMNEQTDTPKLETTDQAAGGMNDQYLSAVIDYFGLWEQLSDSFLTLEELP